MACVKYFFDKELGTERPASAVPATTPTTTSLSKRSSCWRAGRLRLPHQRDRKSWNLPMRQQNHQKWEQLRQSQSETDVISIQSIILTHPPARPSLSTIADAEESSLTSVLSLIPDSATRPHHHRPLPKKICRLGLDRGKRELSLTRYRYLIKSSFSPFKLNAVTLTSAPGLHADQP